jgi:iron complex outermembrane receptor protein
MIFLGALLSFSAVDNESNKGDKMQRMQHNAKPKLIALVIAAVWVNLAHAAEQEAIQEVIVTAQKRSESASRTPVALTALTAADLEKRGVANAADLTNVVPNVQIGTADGGNTNITIRGIGSNNTTEGGDPAAAFHLDGVYLARPDEARTAFFDVARVEVLRGPQGTLYGRNATAGAVNIITGKPDDILAGKLSLDVGNYDLRRLEGMVNLPVNGMLALRVAVLGEHRENTVRTAAPNNAQNTTGARVNALFTYAKDGSVLLTADQTKIKGPNPAGVELPIKDAHGTAGQTNLKTLDAHGDAAYRGVAIEWNQGLGPVTLTYLGAHRTRNVSSDSYEIGGFGPSYSFMTGEARQTSHELRLASNEAGPWKWVAGAYAFDEHQDTASAFSNGVVAGEAPDYASGSRALFGQATYAFTPGLRITAGARTTRDTKSSYGQVSTFTLFGPTRTATTDTGRSWNSTDGKFGVDYELSRGTMVYANVSTGYKAGGFNSASAAGNSPVSPYKPEKLTAVEGGLKTRVFGNAGQLNVSLFHYGYKDLQLNTIVSVGGGAGLVLVNNAATATVNGLEADLRVRTSAAGTFDASFAYTDAKYDAFKNCVYEPDNSLHDCSGNALRNAPRATLTLGYEHRIPIGDGSVTLRADTRFSSEYFNDDTNSALFRQGGYTRSGLSARYDAADYKYYVSAWVRNLENRNVMASRFPAVVGSSYGYMAPPRTVGMSVGYQF